MIHMHPEWSVLQAEERAGVYQDPYEDEALDDEEREEYAQWILSQKSKGTA